MFFPKLKAVKEKYFNVDSFGSLVQGENVPDGSFSEMENLTGERFPLMSIREKRAVYSAPYPLFFEGERVTAVTDTPSGLLICCETAVYLGGVKVEGAVLDPSVTDRAAVLFGRNIFISPDGVYIKRTDEGISVSRCNFTFTSPTAGLCYSTEDGTDIFPDFFGDIPTSASVGNTLVLSDGKKMELMGYTGEKWIKQYDLFIRIDLPSDISGFSAGEVISIKSSGGLIDDGYYTVKRVFSDSLVLTGNLRGDGNISAVTLSKLIPKMDFAVEHNNRIWGCRYGMNNDGSFVNEIYASKLGNPEEWYSFEGISTDSYSVSLGCSGEFTGAAKVGNEVIFFKENFIIRVLGDSPSDFTVCTVPARGVEIGQHRSLVNLGERLFYKGTDGITVYDGTLPFVISERDAFTGFYDASAGAFKGKYFIALTSPRGERAIYIYDTENGLLHREDAGGNLRHFFMKDGNLFWLSENENLSYTLFARDFSRLTEKNKAVPVLGEVAFTPHAEKAVEWYCETGRLCRGITGYNKKIRALRLSLDLGEDAVVRVSVKPDTKEHFREIFYLSRKTDGILSCLVPVEPCKFFTLRIEGRGDFILHGFGAVIKLTSEVRDID